MSKSKKNVRTYFDDDYAYWDKNYGTEVTKADRRRIDKKSKILDEYDTPDKPIKSKWKK